MNTVWLLEQLQEHDLEQFYLKLYSLGIVELNELAKISVNDFSRIGVDNPEDKKKFLQLSQTMKNKLQSRQYTQTSEHIASRKRPVSVVKASTPERKSVRRMTIAPQTIPRIQQKPTYKDRRLSILPRRESVAPDLLQRKKVINPATKRHKTSTEDVITEKRPKTATSNRLLDVYGVPYNQKIKTEETGINHAIPTIKRTIEPVSKLKTAAIPYNELHQRIRVCVRKRPLNKRETLSKEADITSIVGSHTVELHAERMRIDLTRLTETHAFTFDEAFDSHVTNKDVYMRTAQPLIEYIFAGGNGTCFAYSGQTGSGKTHTMLDSTDGLYVLAAQDIFRMLSQPTNSHLSANVGFYEIYQGQLYDLLNQRAKLTARDDGNNNVVIAGLKEFAIKDKEDLIAVFEYGNQGRTTGKTGVNNKSSRSHAVLQIILRLKDKPSEIHGKLSFIDLAGSERGVDRGDANNKTRLEGAEINKSLLALKECIRALDQDRKHAPFRGSKLTQVLRDCFVGGARTCMIATISPNSSNAEHTLNTLRYADRVKQLKGESDPRLTGDNSTDIKTELSTNRNIGIREEEETAEDGQSVANSYTMDEDEQVENLLDIDFPSEVAMNALNTPTNNNRFWKVSNDDYQERLLKPLESPPSEIFFSNLSDPFDSKPLELLRKQGEKKSKCDLERIRKFMKFHRRQIKDLEDCLKEETKLIAKLSLAINSTDEESQLEDNENLKQEYENYLNDLNEISTRVTIGMRMVQDKAKSELDQTK
ncbi:hypothetical protein G6F43_001891 [Rhizopus delemar]|nr:hypothetical protein G6F43_001891 [Rhizopus delemar]